MKNVEQLLLDAADDNKKAQAELSLAYFKGEGVPQDMALAMEWLKKAAEDRELVEKLFTVEGMSAYPQACLVLFRVWARYLKPGTNDDRKKANLFLISAAQSGYHVAEHALGVECQSQIKIAVKFPSYTTLPPEYMNHQQVEYWFKKSLEHGFGDAHRYLYTHYNGTWIKEALNHEKAFYHVSQVVASGNAEAAEDLGGLYANGQGTEKDLVKGAMWLYLAACRKPEGPAADALKSLRAQMADQEYAQAEAEALEWIEINAEASLQFDIDDGLADPLTGTALDIKFTSDGKEPDKSLEKVTGKLSQEKLDLIALWHQYYADEKSISSNKVSHLLTEDPWLTDDQLNDIFQYYDCKKELIKRYRKACDCRFDRSKTDVVLADVEKAARKDLLIKYKICKASDKFDDYEDVLGDVSDKHIKKAEVKLVKSAEFDAQRHNMFYELLPEVIDDHLDTKNIIGLPGLREALYGVTADYNLVYYVLGAFASLKINFEPYIAVQNAGARHDITPDVLLLNLDPRRKVVS